MPTPKIPKIPQKVYDSIAEGKRGVDETIDIWWEEDFKPEMPEIYGILALAQRLIRRLTTPRGLFPWWPNEGLDVRQYLLSKTPLWRIKKDIEAECLRDEQVSSVIATPEYANNNRALNINLFIISAAGNFTFTMTASEAAANLISLQATT